MNTYHIKDPTTGKTVTLRGDSPPTEQELNDIFAKINPPATTNNQQPEQTPIQELARMGTVGAVKGLMAPFETQPAQALEKAGNIVTEAAKSTTKAPLTKMALDAASLTPKNLTLLGGGELAGMLAPMAASQLPIIGTQARKIGAAIAERFLNTQPSILEGKVMRGAVNTGEKLLDMPDMTGTPRTIFSKAMLNKAKLERQISTVLRGSDATVSKADLIGEVDGLISDAAQTGVDQRTVRVLENLKNRFLSNQPDLIPVEQANAIKRTLTSDIGNRAYQAANPRIAAEAEGKIAIANSIRKKLAEAVPGLDKLNREQGLNIEIARSLARRIGMDTKSIAASMGGDVLDAGLLSLARLLHGAPSIPGGSIAGAALNQLGEQSQ